MKKQLNYFLAAVACIFLMSSCASLTGFEEGRVLGEGNSELVISGNLTTVPDLFDDAFGTTDTLGSISFPNIELSYKRGLSEKLDVGARVSTNINASVFGKYQVVGDRSSKFALSPGIELGTIAGVAYTLGVPVYASYYPVEAVAVNLTPRLMYQTFAATNGSDGILYLGGNFGLLFGKKNKFGLDIGYYNLRVNDGSETLITVGVGGKFKFGDFESTSSRGDDSGNERGRKRSSRGRR